MGDFNINLLKIDTNVAVNDFFNTMSSSFFTPFVLQPTRLQSKTLIDNIFFNSLEYLTNSGNLLIELSDHLIQFLLIEGYVKKRAVPVVNHYKRDFKHFNEREFEQEVINKINWEHVCNIKQGNPELSCNNFLKTLNYHLDEYAPFKKVTKNELMLMSKPWITNEILLKCKKRDALLKQKSKEKNLDNITTLQNEYKKLRNEITKDKRDGKNKHQTI